MGVLVITSIAAASELPCANIVPRHKAIPICGYNSVLMQSNAEVSAKEREGEYIIKTASYPKTY